MSDLFWITGLAVWLIVAAGLAWLVVIEWLIVGVANAFSLNLWHVRCSPGFRPIRDLWWMVKNIAADSVKLYAHRNNGSNTYHRQCGGYWHGIGDWRLPTPADQIIVYHDSTQAPDDQ